MKLQGKILPVEYRTNDNQGIDGATVLIDRQDQGGKNRLSIE